MSEPTLPGALPTISLRPFTPGDRFVLNRWLATLHVAAWFGSRAIADAEIAIAQSSPSALCRIIESGGAAIGYAQGVDLALSSAKRPASLPSGSVKLDAFIGDEAARGRGHGATALALLRDEVFAQSLAPAVAVFISIRNEPAVRRIERAGFRWTEIWHDPTLGPCWVLRAERADPRVLRRAT